MDPAGLLALFDREMREHARPDGPGVRVERAGPVVRQVGGADDWNGVVWSPPGLGAGAGPARGAPQEGEITPRGLAGGGWGSNCPGR
ncbi:GNAT family N-acetyltransferase, partial [Streptomyces sp. NPDC005899]